MQSLLSTLNNTCIDAGIEADQHLLMMHGKSQEMNVDDLAMRQQLITTDGGLRRPGELISPELMNGMGQQANQ